MNRNDHLKEAVVYQPFAVMSMFVFRAWSYFFVYEDDDDTTIVIMAMLVIER